VPVDLDIPRVLRDPKVITVDRTALFNRNLSWGR
jgi:hypothetical protein